MYTHDRFIVFKKYIHEITGDILGKTLFYTRYQMLDIELILRYTVQTHTRYLQIFFNLVRCVVLAY